MEVLSENPRRQFRSKSVILEHLKQQQASGSSIQGYCAAQGIATASFHNWKKRYGQQEQSTGSGAFAPLVVSTASAGVLFAEVRGIKLYQAVSAGYLKELSL